MSDIINQTKGEMQERQELLLRRGLSSAEVLDVVHVAEGDYSPTEWAEIRGVTDGAVHNNIRSAEEHYTPGSTLSELRTGGDGYAPEDIPEGVETCPCGLCAREHPETVQMHAHRPGGESENSGSLCMNCAETPNVTQLVRKQSEYGSDVESALRRYRIPHSVEISSYREADDVYQEYALLSGETEDLLVALDAIDFTSGLREDQETRIWWLSDTAVLYAVVNLE